MPTFYPMRRPLNFGVLDRYLVREVVLSFAAVTVVLLLIVTGGNVARLFGLAAEGRLPADVVPAMAMLGMGQAVILILPASLFLATLLTFGRLHRDSEMTAVAAAGIGPGRIYRSLAWFVLPLALVQGWLTLAVAPNISVRMDAIKAEVERRSELLAVTPGRFIMTRSGDVVFVESLDGGRLGPVFIYSGGGDGQKIVIASGGEQHFDAQRRERFLVLHEGHRYEGRAGGGAYTITDFARHGLLVPDPKVGVEPGHRDSITTMTLLSSAEPLHRAELHWRLSFPLSLLLLTLLALPLSRSSPRQGRYARLAVGVLIYAIYFNTLASGRTAIAAGSLPPWLGLWWVHAVLLGVALLLLARQLGFLRVRIGRRRLKEERA